MVKKSELNLSNGYGIAGFVLGLLSVFFVLIFFISLPMAILGLIFSIIQKKKKSTSLATSGLVLSIIGILGSLGIIALIATGIYTSGWLSELNVETEDSIVIITYDFEYKDSEGKNFKNSLGGSGVIFSSENGLVRVLTNRHVVDCGFSNLCGQRTSETFKMATKEGKNIVAERVYISPYKMDLAILDFRTQGNYKTASISKDIAEDDKVVAIGFTSFVQGAREFSKATGVISQFKDLVTEEGYRFKGIDSSAYTYYGSSGGGLFDEKGNLIGINSWGDYLGFSSYAISSESFPDFNSFITCNGGYVLDNGCVQYCKWVLNSEMKCVEPCTDFYCETDERKGRDNRCPNDMVLGSDDYCHPPCGSNTGYCVSGYSVCYNDKCVSCPQGFRLYKDGNCYTS